MFFAKSFEIWRVIGIMRMDVIKIVIRIVVRFVFVSCVICDIAAATPVRDFWIRKSVMNEIEITSVFIEPRRIRNCSLFSLPVIFDPMIAA